MDDERAFGWHGQAAAFQVVHHRGDELVDVAFALPPVEVDVERVELAAHAFERDAAEMFPQRAVAGAAGL